MHFKRGKRRQTRGGQRVRGKKKKLEKVRSEDMKKIRKGENRK